MDVPDPCEGFIKEFGADYLKVFVSPEIERYTTQLVVEPTGADYNGVWCYIVIPNSNLNRFRFETPFYNSYQNACDSFARVVGILKISKEEAITRLLRADIISEDDIEDIEKYLTNYRPLERLAAADPVRVLYWRN